MSDVKSGSLTQKRYHIGPSSHFNFKGLFKDCSHVLSKCWAQSQYSLSRVTTAGKRRGRMSSRVSCVWLQRDWKWAGTSYTGGKPYCALYLHCTSTARCMETRAKNTIILYKYPCPKISWRMSVRAELGARGRSTFGKRYFWTACIHILEYLLCIPLMKSSTLMEGIFNTVRLFHPACLPRAWEECRAAKRSWL